MSKLTDLAAGYEAAKQAERDKLDRLRAEVRKQAEAGLTEAELERQSGLSRTTVRRILGRPVAQWNPSTDEPPIQARARGPRRRGPRARLGMAAELPDTHERG